MNHFVDAVVETLPLVTSSLIFATRYYIIHATGIVMTALVIFAGIRNNRSIQDALRYLILAGITFVLLGLAAFTISIGACMCDAWRQWKPHESIQH